MNDSQAHTYAIIELRDSALSGPLNTPRMSFSGFMNLPGLFVCRKGHDNERHTHVREWIASLANRA